MKVKLIGKVGMVNTLRLKLLFNSILKTLGSELYGVVLFDRENNRIEEMFHDELDPSLFSHISQLLDSKIIEMSSEFSGENIGTLTFAVDNVRFLLSEAGSDAILVCVSPGSMSPNVLFPYVYILAEKIHRLYLEKEISLVIPRFTQQELTKSFPDLSKIHLDSGEFSIKLILGGQSAVGKTTLVEKFITDTFQHNYKSTIGVNIMHRNLEFPVWKINLHYAIYDLAGQNEFQDVRKTYFLGARAGFLVFDVTRRETFEAIESWYKEITSIVPEIMIILVGNKIDLNESRVVTHQEGKNLAKKLQLKYLETSALNKDFVDEAFRTLGFLYVLKNRVVKIVQTS